MSNEDIIDYVMESPDNTNPNVLRGLLDQNSGNTGGILVIQDNNGTLNKTGNEILEALQAGKICYVYKASDTSFVRTGFVSQYYSGSGYTFEVTGMNNDFYESDGSGGYIYLPTIKVYKCNSLSDYPSTNG